MKMTSRFLLPLFLVAATCSAPTWADMVHFNVPLKPVAGSTAQGKVEAMLDTATAHLTWNITFSNLSGPLTAAHFHGPAAPGEKGPVAIEVTGDLISPMKGEATLTPDQEKDLMAGKWYVNLHTAAHKPGELRGQLTH